jgi:hypothetical protein
MRALKRRLSDIVYRTMLETRSATTSVLRGRTRVGHRGNDSHSSATGLQPHTSSSDKPHPSPSKTHLEPHYRPRLDTEGCHERAIVCPQPLTSCQASPPGSSRPLTSLRNTAKAANATSAVKVVHPAGSCPPSSPSAKTPTTTTATKPNRAHAMGFIMRTMLAARLVRSSAGPHRSRQIRARRRERYAASEGAQVEPVGSTPIRWIRPGLSPCRCST